MDVSMLRMSIKVMFLLLLFSSCEEKRVDKEAYEINKAVELIDGNKSIDAKFLEFRKELGVKFVLCYVITSEKHRRLGFQILQSDSIKSPPLTIRGLYKIKNIHGVDIIIVSSEMKESKKYKVEIETDTKELIRKGYLTVKNHSSCMQGGSVDFVFCKNNDNVFTELTFDFLGKEEEKVRAIGEPFHEEKFYPNCN